MKKYIIELFSLTGVIVDNLEIKKEGALIKIRSPRMWDWCPSCGNKCHRIYDRKYRKILHDTLNNQRIFLLLKQRRFKCGCGKIFTESIIGISRKRFSEHFRKKCLVALKENSFLSVSKTYAISIPTLVSIMKEYHQSASWPSGELRLNIDEHSFRGRDLKITIGENRTKTLLEVLQNDNQETLQRRLKSLPDPVKQRVSEVCIDMKQSYLKAIEAELPNAKIVVDKFHVIKEILRQMEDMRKILQSLNVKNYRRINRFLLLKNRERLNQEEISRLNDVFKRYDKFPTLKECYLIKERVRKMYKSKDREVAEKELNLILLSIENYSVGKIKEIHGTLSRWKPYILNYFENRTTNAFIEGCHNKIKLIKRTSYGFRNFQNYVMKITLAFLPFLVERFPH